MANLELFHQENAGVIAMATFNEFIELFSYPLYFPELAPTSKIEEMAWGKEIWLLEWSCRSNSHLSCGNREISLFGRVQKFWETLDEGLRDQRRRRWEIKLLSEEKPLSPSKKHGLFQSLSSNGNMESKVNFDSYHCSTTNFVEIFQ